MTVQALSELGASPSADAVEGYARSELSGFFASRVNPGAAERDAQNTCLPADIFREAAQLGLLAYLLPKEVGGLGGNRRTFGLLLEQIGYLCEEVEFASLLSLYADIPTLICDTGERELIERYVVPMSRGTRFATFAYTERTDALSFSSRAVQRGKHYVLSGEKCLQTGGQLADTFLTYVRDERDDLQLFLLEREDPGVEISPVETTGFRSAGLTRLRFTDVELPDSRRIVPVDGLSHVQKFLNNRRLFVACPFVGRMRAIVEDCVLHLRGVVRYDKPLTETQAVQAKLGGMYIRYETARAVLRDALERVGGRHQNPLFDPVISAAKYTVVEHALAVAKDAIYLTGWRGFSKELPFERYFRSFMGGIAGQTAQDVIELLLGSNVVAQVELRLHKEKT